MRREPSSSCRRLAPRVWCAAFARCAPLVVATLLVAACQTSEHARRAGVAAASQDPLAAIAHYRAALRDERFEPAARAEISERLDRVACGWVAQEVAETSSVAADEARRQLLVLLASTKAWETPFAKSLVERSIGERAQAAWPAIEALAARGHFLQAVAEAERWRGGLPAGHPLLASLDDLRRRGVEQHLAAGAGALPSAARLHALIAAHLGGTTPPTRAGASGSRFALFAPSAGCGWVARGLGSATTTAAASLRLDLERCESEQTTTSKSEPETYTDQIAELVPVQERVEVWQHDPACEARRCLRFDPLGACLEHERAELDCEARPVLRPRVTPVLRYKTVTASRTREVFERRTSTRVKAWLWAGDQAVPITIRKEQPEIGYWSPAGSRLFAPGLLDAQKSEAVEDLLAQLRAGELELAQRDMPRLLSEARRARQNNDPRAEEDFLARAVLLRPNEREAAAWFASRYGADAKTLTQLLRGAKEPPIVSAPLALPDLDPAPVLALHRRAPVVTTSTLRGLELFNEAGIDLYFAVDRSTLSTAPRMAGAGVRIRGDGIHMDLFGHARQLGGQAAGFEVSMAGAATELDHHGFLFLSGFGAGYDRAPTGEDALWIGPVFDFRLALLSLVTLELDFRPNLAQLKTWIKPAGGDPRAYSPIKLGLVLDLLQRFYLDVHLRYFLGIGGDLHYGAALGIRL